MTLRQSIAALVAAAPPDATVQVRWLAELLEADTSERAVVTEPSGPTLVVDLTVQQVAERFNRGVSTIRTWLAAGLLPGAYRLHGREWRIPLSAIESMQRTQSHSQPATSTASPTTSPRSEITPDLGGWRKHLHRTARAAS